MAFGRRYTRRRSYRRRRYTRRERQRIIYPAADVANNTQATWTLWQNWRSGFGAVSSPVSPGTGGQVGAVVQEPVSQYIGKFKIDFIQAPVGLRFLVVYWPASNAAYSNMATSGTAEPLVPSAVWTNTTTVPASIYEPNQHVIGYGMITDEKKSFYFSKTRRLYSGDRVLLMCQHSTGESETVSMQASFSLR